MRNFFVAVLLAAPLTGYAAEQMIPAGSLIHCTVSEPRLSSKTAEIGDPVLCQVGHVELYGRSVLPYGSYLEGRFEDYRDPGHFYGKGWMELKFDRMFIPPGTVIPVSAKVVYVPKFPVDKEGKIHGNGHPVRDTVEWMIPVLWPIDLLTLPRRGPRPVLKAETRLTLKIMDDFGVPSTEQAAYQQPQQPRDQYGYGQRAPQPAPMTYAAPVAPAPVYRQMSYTVPPTAPPLIPPSVTMLMLRDGHRRLATEYWVEAGGQVRYVALNGTAMYFPMAMLDVPASVAVNRTRGVEFTMASVEY